MVFVRMISFLCLLVVTMVSLPSTVQAETKAGHARSMAQQGGLFHDGSAGRENVYMDSGPRLGSRFRAKVAWRGSPGHRANLPMVGLRVRSSGRMNYVVGRR